MSTPLARLQSWYASQCNEDWEHSYGVSIGTLDNPGWLVEVDLTETELLEKPFNPVNRGDGETDDDWIACKTESGKFIGACGPFNLEETLSVFLDWATLHATDAV